MDKVSEGNTPPRTVVIVQHRKSMVLALLLTFFFGPLGMLYATIGGGIIMLIVGFIVGILTLGIGLVFLWPVQLVWAAIAVNNYNARQSVRAKRMNR